MDIEQLQQEKRDIKKLLSDKIDKIDEQIKVEKERLAIIEEKKLLDIIKYENRILYLKAKKRNACTDSIQDTEARQLALKVIEAIENKFYDLTNTRFFEHLDDSAPIDSEYYYEFEDVATEVINDYKSNIR